MDIGQYIIVVQVDMCLTAHSYIASLGYILQQFNNYQQPSKPRPRPRLQWLGVEKPGDHRHPAAESWIILTYMQDCSPFEI
jgi:hypothetical protein